MKINTAINNPYPLQRTQVSAAASTNPASFAAALSAATAESSTAKQADFTNMTRKEMFDWMNDQIRS